MGDEINTAAPVIENASEGATTLEPGQEQPISAEVAAFLPDAVEAPAVATEVPVVEPQPQVTPEPQVQPAEAPPVAQPWDEQINSLRNEISGGINDLKSQLGRVLKSNTQPLYPGQQQQPVNPQVYNPPVQQPQVFANQVPVQAMPQLPDSVFEGYEDRDTLIAAMQSIGNQSALATVQNLIAQAQQVQDQANYSKGILDQVLPNMNELLPDMVSIMRQQGVNENAISQFKTNPYGADVAAVLSYGTQAKDNRARAQQLTATTQIAQKINTAVSQATPVTGGTSQVVAPTLSERLAKMPSDQIVEYYSKLSPQQQAALQKEVGNV